MYSAIAAIASAVLAVILAKPTHFAQLAGPGEVQTHRSRPACEYS
jgi:hypothetical protein